MSPGCVSLQRTLQVRVYRCLVEGTWEAELSGMFINRRPARKCGAVHSDALFSLRERNVICWRVDGTEEHRTPCGVSKHDTRGGIQILTKLIQQEVDVEMVLHGGVGAQWRGEGDKIE